MKGNTKRKTKVTISIVLMLLTVVSSLAITSASGNIVDSMEFQGEALEITLQDAYKLMLDNNTTLKKVSLDVEQADLDYKKSLSAINKTRSALRFTNVTSPDYLESVTLTEMNSLFTKGNAGRNYEATMEALKADLESTYYQLLHAEKIKKIYEDRLKVAETTYNTTKTKFRLGIVSRNEVISAELALINSKNDLETGRNNVDSMRMLLNTKLKLDIMKNIMLKDELKKVEYTLPSIAKAVSSALENRKEIKAAKHGYHIEDVNMQIAKGKYSTDSYPYKKAVINLEKAEADYSDALKNLEMEVRNNYLAINHKLNEINAWTKSVELAEESLKIKQLSYDKGLAILSDVEKANVELLQAKLSMSQSILDYNLAVLKFEDSLGVGRATLSGQ